MKILEKNKLDTINSDDFLNDKSPKNHLDFISIAKHFRQSGKIEEAEIIIKDGLVRFPNKLSLMILDAQSSMIKKDWESSIFKWKHIISVHGFHTGVYSELIKSYINSHRLNEAKDLLKELVAINGESTKTEDTFNLISSLQSRKYELIQKILTNEIAFNIDSIKHQKIISKIDGFKKIQLKGWIKKRKNQNIEILIKNSDGKTELFSLNTKRSDVVNYFKEPELDDNCGFDFTYDTTKNPTICAVIDGKFYDLASLELKKIKDVLEGKDGWLFLANDTNGSIDQFTGKLLISEESLSDWKNNLKEFEFINEKVKLLFCISNSKESVFPNLYPYKKSDTSTLEKVSNLFTDKKIPFVNPLLKLREFQESYYKTDTHWSDLGAYLTYIECLNSIGLEGSLKNIEFIDKEASGDLGSKLSTIQRSLRKQHIFPENSSKEIFSNDFKSTGKIKIFENTEFRDDKKVLLFGGSSLFGGEFARYFSYFFKRVVAVSTPGILINEIVSHENPDIIIIQINERYLITPPKIINKYSDHTSFERIKKENADIINSLKEKYKNEFYIRILE